MIDSRLRKFARLFNDKQFFEAHEVLEDLWLESEGEIKDFYKGLIQCAVAFVHLQRHNSRGAHKLFTSSTGYLRKYLPKYGCVDTANLLKNFEDFFGRVVKKAEQQGRPVDLRAAALPWITLLEEVENKK
jgi:hypothetical protein